MGSSWNIPDSISAPETPFEERKLEVKNFTGDVSMGDMGVLDTTFQRLDGSLSLIVVPEISLKILDSISMVQSATSLPSTESVELRISKFTGNIKLNAIQGSSR